MTTSPATLTGNNFHHFLGRYLNMRSRALAGVERELRNTSFILAEYTDRALQELDLVQHNLIERMQASGIETSEAYEQMMAGEDVHRMLKDKINGLPHVDAITMINAQGTLINFSRYWPVPVVNVSDRDYFKALTSDPALMSYVSAPVHNRGTGTWTIYLARKFTAPDGTFVGLVLGAIELRYFEEFYRSILLGPESVIALFRRDGVLLARCPHVEQAIGQSIGDGADFAAVVSGARQATVRQVSKVDGLDRLRTGTTVEHYPLILVATTTFSAALAGWWEQVHYLIGATILLVFMIGSIGVVVVGRLRDQNSRLDTALNNIPQGVGLFDRAQRLIVSNRRYAELFALPSGLVKPGTPVRKILQHRIEKGIYPGEDCDAYLRQRTQVVAENKPHHSLWDLRDGRTFAVSHQPIPTGGWCATIDDITERRSADKRIAHLAHHDPLTDLPNRIAFNEYLAAALERGRAKKSRLALLLLDLDRFKEVNDLFGHAVGDLLLREVCARLHAAAKGHFLARLGGDEFIIVVEGEQPATATQVAEVIRNGLLSEIEVDGQKLRVESSIGIAIFPADGLDAVTLLRNADAALYRAKADGRGEIRFFTSDLDRQQRERRTLSHDLRGACDRGELALHYQPQACIRGGISGFEALLRWHHPTRGLIPPATFIPIAEESRLITEIGEWVLREACAEAARWSRPLRIAVNVSAVQFRRTNLSRLVHTVLLETGLQPSRLELEITESLLIDDISRAQAVLQQLKALGVLVAMDDFGTGYSSLAYLHSFPLSKLKIDRSFISTSAGDEQSATIVRTIIGLGHGLGLPVLAEGVETEEQREFLAREGCNEIQGYLIGRPQPIDAYRVLTGHAPASDTEAIAASGEPIELAAAVKLVPPQSPPAAKKIRTKAAG